MRPLKPVLTSLALTLLASLLMTPAFAGKVEIKKQDNKATITIDGEHFATYNFADDQAKPYFHPVYAPGKTLVVREQVFGPEGQQGNDLKTNMGHFHHKGVWVAVDTVNEEKLNYWHEKHKIRTDKVEVKQDGDNAVLQLHNSWLDDAGQPLLKEETQYTITPDRLLICDLKLTALDKSVTFGDTKEGLFGIRVFHSMRGVDGGKITNSEGGQGEKECWGKTADWVDYTGEVDGKTVGVTIMDGPKNFRPSRYHVRNYGLFSVSPFGESSYTNGKEEAKPVTLEPGKSLELRYGMLIHTGDVKEGQVAEHYKKFLSAK